MPAQAIPPSGPHHSFWRSFHIALAGALHVLRTERNAQIEGLIGLVSVGLGLALGLTRTEWAIVCILIVLVLGLEMVNTAVEAAVDLACPAPHPLAKKAKDSAAGAVVLAALGSVIVGLIIFLPRVWWLLSGWFWR